MMMIAFSGAGAFVKWALWIILPMIQGATIKATILVAFALPLALLPEEDLKDFIGDVVKGDKVLINEEALACLALALGASAIDTLEQLLAMEPTTGTELPFGSSVPPCGSTHCPKQLLQIAWILLSKLILIPKLLRSVWIPLFLCRPCLLIGNIGVRVV